MKKNYQDQPVAGHPLAGIIALFLFLLFLWSPAMLTGGTISGTFTTLTDCPVNLSAMAVNPATGYFYAVADQEGGPAYYRYDATTNTWTTLTAPPHVTGNNAGATFLNGKIYIAYTSYDNLSVYDIASDTWTEITGPTNGVNSGDISNDGVDIYVACSGDPGNFWKYSVAGATWTALAQVPHAQPWGGLAYNNGYFYMSEGNGNVGFHRYHVLTDSWEVLTDVPDGAVLGAAIYDAYYYCMGSYDGTNLYSYDLGEQVWNNTLTLPWSIDDATICVYQGSLYIIQGEAGQGFVKFTPNNPILANMEPALIRYTIGSGAVNITSTLTASQNLGTNFESATVSINETYESGKDVLSFVNAYGITGSWDAGTGVLTLTGTASIANYQSALRSVQYSNGDVSSAGLRSIAFKVYDGSIYSNTATRNLAFPGPPTVTTADIADITEVSATSGGNVVDDGGLPPVSARGVCWNTTGAPTTADDYTTDGTGMGSFTSAITSLTVGTTYYVRAYATNSSGTSYGGEKVFVATNDEYYVTAGNDATITAGEDYTLAGIVQGPYPVDYFNWSTSGDGYFTPNDWSTLTPTYIPGSSDITAGFVTLSLSATFTGPASPTVGDNMDLTIESGEDPPVSGTLNKTPDVLTVCVGTVVSATLTPGSGGNGTDETDYRTHDGTSWSTWSSYTPGDNIPTTGQTGVQIRTRRLADSHPNAAYNTVEWAVESTPTEGSLTKTPDEMNVCQGTNVSAALTPGTGGNGTDETQYRTYAGTWSDWTTYVSGTNISTTGKTAVEIQTRRLADVCSASAYTTVSWSVEVTPVAGTLAKTPDVLRVCEGTNVSALLTPGTGGAGTDETEYRTHDGTEWNSWTTYASGTPISTSGKTGVEIQTRRMGTSCSNSTYNTVSWTVEQTPYAGLLEGDPIDAEVCEGTNVSAMLDEGEGGNGTDETEYHTFNGSVWTSWATYVSGISISTSGKTQVEIRTRRLADYCANSGYYTVSWQIEQTPVSGTLSKTPDLLNICEGTNVSAALAAGSGGNGADILEYRTLTGVAWSEWQTYTSGQSVSTTGLSGVEIQTYRQGTYCNDASTVTVSWGVDPTTVGGEVTGGGSVCYGTNSTLLTLSGHVGTILRWEWSTNNVDWNVIANTSDTYTATNLVQNTWFRAVAKSGVCGEENSSATQITMFTDYHVSGYAKYYNNPKTPLNQLKITLKKSGIIQGSPVVTGTNGYFDFGGLTNGNYDLEVTSAHPSGEWQTWNGVNNTDYLLVSRHATGVALLKTEPPVVRVSADVIDPQTPPIITTVDAEAVKNAAKYGWFMPGTTTPWFDTPKWVFSGTTTANSITGFELNCNNLTRDLYGLCAGDVNGSYVPPNGWKQAEASLELVQRGTLPIMEEMIFPMRAATDMEIGAITLMLNFDPAIMEITGVDMPENKGQEPYFIVNGNQLHIGWMSMDPLHVVEGEPVLLIKARISNVEYRMLNVERQIRFTLSDSPLSELADAEGMVLQGAKLTVAGGCHSSALLPEMTLHLYPNPAGDVVNIEAVLPDDGDLKAEIIDIHGITLTIHAFNNLKAGVTRKALRLDGIPSGLYLVKISCGENVSTGRLVINK